MLILCNLLTNISDRNLSDVTESVVPDLIIVWSGGEREISLKNCSNLDAFTCTKVLK